MIRRQNLQHHPHLKPASSFYASLFWEGGTLLTHYPSPSLGLSLLVPSHSSPNDRPNPARLFRYHSSNTTSPVPVHVSCPESCHHPLSWDRHSGKRKGAQRLTALQPTGDAQACLKDGGKLPWADCKARLSVAGEVSVFSEPSMRLGPGKSHLFLGKQTGVWKLSYEKAPQ